MTEVAIEREIGSRTIAAGEARTAVLRQRYDAEIADVWDACTSAERLQRWFLPISGDLRVGGRFQFEGNAGGEIVECEPPRLLRVTWQYGDRPVDEVRLRLSAGPDRSTVLELEHSTVSTLVEWEGQMLDVIPGVGSGWELPLTYSLPMLLRGEMPDVPTGEWYDESAPEVQAMIERSTTAWAELVTRA